jgi:hypothetical protein
MSHHQYHRQRDDAHMLNHRTVMDTLRSISRRIAYYSSVPSLLITAIAFALTAARIGAVVTPTGSLLGGIVNTFIHSSEWICFIIIPLLRWSHDIDVVMDLRPGFTPSYAYDSLAALGPDGRNVYFGV